jgi:hypothetical protein
VKKSTFGFLQVIENVSPSAKDRLQRIQLQNCSMHKLVFSQEFDFFTASISGCCLSICQGRHNSGTFKTVAGISEKWLSTPTKSYVSLYNMGAG